jgi:hypothetical protein
LSDPKVAVAFIDRRLTVGADRPQVLMDFISGTCVQMKQHKNADERQTEEKMPNVSTEEAAAIAAGGSVVGTSVDGQPLVEGPNSE